MANHELKGYVPLRRGLLKHLAIMSGSELKVYNALLILGDFRTGRVNISLSDLADKIGLSYKIVQVAAKRLKAMRYIGITPAKNQWNDTKFVVLKWKMVKALSTEPTPEPMPEAGTEPMPEAQAQYQRKQAPKKSEEVLRSKDKYITSQDKKLATRLFTEIQKNYPNAKQPNYDTWAYDINKLHRIDKRSYEDIEAAIKWCQHDSFWCSNILSAKKLRKQFPRLKLQQTGTTKLKPPEHREFPKCSVCRGSLDDRYEKEAGKCGKCQEKESKWRGNPRG